jgi:flagellar hook-associated protein 3 FlgL
MLNNMLAGMNSSAQTMIRHQNQLATGKRVQKPSDDPGGVVHILSLRTTLHQVEAHLSNIAQANEWLAISEASLSRAAGIVAQALECAQRGASDVLPQPARNAIAGEVSALLEALLTTANTRHVDRYLFAGTRNRQAPFELTGNPPGAYAFLGNANGLSWEIEPGVVQTVSTDGEAVFGPAFTALIDLRDNLLAGNTTAISGTDVATLGLAHDRILAAVTDVGARVRRLDESHAGLTAVRHTVFDQLNRYESADMAEAIMRLQMAESAYSAAQGATARIIRSTLVDLIR